MTAEDFDPASVPRFPVFTLVLNEDEKSVELDGLVIEPALGEEPKDAGIAAVVQKLKAHRMDAVRVRARTGTDDDFWDLVVTDHGNVYDVTPSVSSDTNPIKRRKYLALIAGLSCLALVGVGTAVVAIKNSRPAEPVVWTVPGQGAQIPVALPQGFKTTSAWSVPVKKKSTTAILATGHVLSTDQAGNVVARDPKTGQPVWTGDAAPADLGTVHQSMWVETPILAAESDRSLRLWDLRTPAGGGLVASRTIPITNADHVELGGPSPFINRGDWIVTLPATDLGTRNTVIPAGTHPVLADETGTLTVIGRDTLQKISADGTVTETKPFTAPKGVPGQPTSSWVLDDTHVLVGWGGKSPILAVVDIAAGKITAAQNARNLPRAQEKIHTDPTTKTAVLGNYRIIFGPKASISPVEGFKAETLHNGIAYGETTEGPASLNLLNGGNPQHWVTFTPDDPAPTAVTGDAAYVVAPVLDQTILYRADRD